MAKTATQNAPASRPQASQKNENTSQTSQAQVSSNGNGKLPLERLDTKAKLALVPYAKGTLTELSVPSDWDYRKHKPLSTRVFADSVDKEARKKVIREFYAANRDAILAQGNKIPFLFEGDELLTELPIGAFDSSIHQPLTEDSFKNWEMFFDWKAHLRSLEEKEDNRERAIRKTISDQPAKNQKAVAVVLAMLSAEEQESLLAQIAKKK